MCPFRWNAGILLKLCSECLTELQSDLPWWGVSLGRGVRESPGFPLSGGVGPSLCFSPFGRPCCGKRNAMARWAAVPGRRESPLSVRLGAQAPLMNCWGWGRGRGELSINNGPVGDKYRGSPTCQGDLCVVTILPVLSGTAPCGGIEGITEPW